MLKLRNYERFIRKIESSTKRGGLDHRGRSFDYCGGGFREDQGVDTSRGVFDPGETGFTAEYFGGDFYEQGGARDERKDFGTFE